MSSYAVDAYAEGAASRWADAVALATAATVLATDAAEGAYSAAGKADAYEAAVHAAYSADCARSAGGWAAASLAPNSAKEIIEYVRGVKKEVAWQGDRLMEFWEEP